LVSTAVRSKRVKTREFYSNTAGGNSARKFIAHTNQVEVEREMTTGA
jgi:hypothetical protein